MSSAKRKMQHELGKAAGTRALSRLMQAAWTCSRRLGAVIMAAGLLLFPLAGCSSGKSADSAGTDDGLITNVPPIYVEQPVVAVDHGVPMQERQYREALANCQRSPFPTRPLAAEDVAKIGRTFHKLWFEGDRWAAQSDTWTYALPKACQFELVHEKSVRGIDTGKTLYSIDLLKGTAEQSPSDGGRAALLPGDDQLDPAAAQLGEQRLGYAEAVGQPCLRWRNPTGVESCTWSGGYKWGFARDDSSDEAPSYGSGTQIALWVKPVNGYGLELTTQKMSVGTSIGDKVFKLPSNIAVGKAD